MNCQKCQKEVFLPFKCPYCGGNFCSEHRLLENHECPKIELAREAREEQHAVAQTPKSYDYTISYAPQRQPVGRIRFSQKEAKHLAVAALLVVAIGFSPALYIRFELIALALLTAVLTSSFFIHEIAHKAAAQRLGLWAEFRLTLMGAVLTLVSVFSPLFKIISPGAVMVAGYADTKSMGKISVAGPLTNIVLAAVSLALASVVPAFALIFALGAFFNGWIAVFNLIPFGILDGFKIFRWDKGVWALAFAASLALTMVSYQQIA